jgi:hypothetical protein
MKGYVESRMIEYVKTKSIFIENFIRNLKRTLPFKNRVDPVYVI